MSYSCSDFNVPFFSACGNFVSILGSGGLEVARVIQHQDRPGLETRDELIDRAQVLCDILNKGSK